MTHGLTLAAFTAGVAADELEVGPALLHPNIAPATVINNNPEIKVRINPFQLIGLGRDTPPV